MWVSPWQVESTTTTTLPGPGAGHAAAEPGDHRLIARAKDGDRDALAALLRRHRERIHATARRLLGNAADADDVAQDVAITLWTSLSAFGGDAAFTTWLHRVVVNQCLNHRRGRRPLEELREGDHPVAPGPEHHVLAASEMAAGLAALEDLPRDLRAVVALVHLEGLTYRQAAVALQVPEATVRGRLARARAQLVRQVHQ